MTDRPFRLRVLDALTTCLAGITPANGYAHDLTDAVFRGRIHFSDDDPIPMLAILEPEPAEFLMPGADGATMIGGWPLVIQGFVTDDPINPTDPAAMLLADVKKALIKARRQGEGYDILGFDGKVTEIKIGGGGCRPPDDLSAMAYFGLPIELGLAEDLENPFS